MNRFNEKVPTRYLITEEETPKWISNIDALTETDLIKAGITEFDFDPNYTEELEWIRFFVEQSNESDLTHEVIFTAIKLKEKYPNLSPAMVMKLGWMEWIK